MRLGVAVADFTWPGGAKEIAPRLREFARTAEDAGMARLAVMDHLWQFGSAGAAEREMLESYTTLGFLAACTERVELLTLVTAVTYREPGLLAKIVTTLDVLSGGRGMLGIGTGAPFNVEEASGLGLPLPALSERFERLEEALQVCRQMWSQDDSSYRGRHYRLGRTLNSPQPIRRPPILIGGSGERKTLRLVAEYADACNLFLGPDLPRKLDVLRLHCDAVGRDYDEIEKTVMVPLDPGSRGERVPELLDLLGRLAELGVDQAQGPLRGRHHLDALRVLGEQVVPVATRLPAHGRRTPVRLP